MSKTRRELRFRLRYLRWKMPMQAENSRQPPVIWSACLIRPAVHDVITIGRQTHRDDVVGHSSRYLEPASRREESGPPRGKLFLVPRAREGPSGSRPPNHQSMVLWVLLDVHAGRLIS
jgi:hypothetical protein